MISLGLACETWHDMKEVEAGVELTVTLAAVGHFVLQVRSSCLLIQAGLLINTGEVNVSSIVDQSHLGILPLFWHELMSPFHGFCIPNLETGQLQLKSDFLTIRFAHYG